MSQFFASGGQSTGASASTSVLPMNTQDWCPLGWTGWISLQPKGLSRVFSNTTVQSINSSMVSLLYSPTLTSIHDYWKNHNSDIGIFVSKAMSLLFNLLLRDNHKFVCYICWFYFSIVKSHIDWKEKAKLCLFTKWHNCLHRKFQSISKILLKLTSKLNMVSDRTAYQNQLYFHILKLKYWKLR